MATVAGRRRWLYVEVPEAGGQCKTAFCPQRVERRSPVKRADFSRCHFRSFTNTLSRAPADPLCPLRQQERVDRFAVQPKPSSVAHRKQGDAEHS